MRTTIPLFVISSVLCATVAQAGILVVPNELAGVEGDVNLCFPFGCSDIQTGSSYRAQQVFASSEFGIGGLITQVAFRPDGLTTVGGVSFVTGRAFPATLLSHVQINLSSTSAAPDGLSATFASNVGANDTIVFDGSLSLSSSFTGPADGPKAFDIVINLTTPFLYTPRSGNLLLDIRDFSAGGVIVSPLDAQNTIGDSISRVFTNDAGNVGDVAGIFSSNALVTQFTIDSSTSVPEPRSFGLFVVMGVSTLVARRLRKSNQS